MAKKVEIEVDVKGNVVESAKNLRALKQQLKELPAGTAEWNKVFNQIDDLEDKLKSAKSTGSDWIDSLENAGGPLGMLGKGLNSAKVATQSFGAALKATGIGLLVSIIGGLVAAFTQTEGSMKKLQPILIQFEKIFGGIVEAMQPVLDMILSLAVKALPMVTNAFKVVYSAISSFLQGIGKIGEAVYKLIKGDFGGAWDAAKESVTGFGKRYTEATQNFEKGASKMTKTEKENLKAREDARKEALDKQIKELENKDKLDAAQLEKQKQIALAAAETEQEKLDVEKKFAKLSYDATLKDIEDKLKLYKGDKDKTSALLAEKAKVEGDYIKQTSDFKKTQGEIDKKNTEDTLHEELNTLQKNLAQGKLTQEQYEDSVYQTKKKYLKDKKALDDLEVEREKQLEARKKKKADSDRALAFSVLQDEINALDRKNERYENDFKDDIARLEEKKKLLQQQRDLELSAVENDEQKKLEIKKKYGDQIGQVEKTITDTQRAEQEARFALQAQYADAIGQFGAFLQQVAGKNKGLAKTGLLIEKAAAVATIVINTQKAASKIASTSPLGYADPRAILTYVTGGLSVGTAIAAAIKGVKEIDGAGGDSGGQKSGENFGKNYGDGGMINGPRHAQGGVMINAEGGEAVMTRGAVTMFKPLLSMMNQMGGGTSFNSGAVGRPYPDAPELSTPNQSPIIMKTYVVSHELTSEAERQAKLKDLSTL